MNKKFQYQRFSLFFLEQANRVGHARIRIRCYRTRLQPPVSRWRNRFCVFRRAFRRPIEDKIRYAKASMSPIQLVYHPRSPREASEDRKSDLSKSESFFQI